MAFIVKVPTVFMCGKWLFPFGIDGSGSTATGGQKSIILWKLVVPIEYINHSSADGYVVAGGVKRVVPHIFYCFCIEFMVLNLHIPKQHLVSIGIQKNIYFVVFIATQHKWQMIIKQHKDVCNNDFLLFNDATRAMVFAFSCPFS